MFTASSALDKLLGQLGIYATWLSSIAFLQKQLSIFIFFTPHFLFLWLHLFLLHEAIGNVLAIYSLPSSAFLKYQTREFYCTWSKSHPFVDIRACILCKVSLSSECFSAKYWTGQRYFHKIGVYCVLASKNKINTRLAFVYIQMETKWTKWYTMTSHVIAYWSLGLLFGTHTFHFNCFFDDFNRVFTQIHCLCRVLCIHMSSIHLSRFSNFLSSKTTGPIELKFHMKTPMDMGTKVCSNGPGHINKMAATPIYGKNPFKIFFPSTRRLMTIGLGM